MAERRSYPLIRRRHTIQGIVQGVGFRPFVYRLAHELGLTGWVRNTPAGVEIEIQGNEQHHLAFEEALRTALPPLAVITAHSSSDTPPGSETTFTILPSGSGAADIQIAPDSALCPDCLRELFDPTDRRYRYPFITCTNCGPRYSIITGIPYDRPFTTMAGFPLCPDCMKEYHDPLDRRFHAQPIACHACGPQVSLVRSPSPALPLLGREKYSSPQRGEAGRGEDAICQAIELLKSGAILAIKGIGGYHLAVDACNHEAVQRLRERKKRDEKPFAVMAADLETARTLAQMDTMEERLLCSPETPIVIVRKQPDTALSPLVAPNNGWLGLMLPYAPLHHLLFQASGVMSKEIGVFSDPAPSHLTPHSSPLTPSPSPYPSPLGRGDSVTLSLRERVAKGRMRALVMTSGNISDEPVAFEDDNALKRLAEIADYFLIHDRPIHIRSDDSVLRVFQGKPLFYRRARGYAPRAVPLPFAVPPLLAAGAELKSAICLADGSRAVLSQHIGDLQNRATLNSFEHSVTHLTTLLEIKPTLIACDLHPDYLSSRYAEDSGLPLVRVQHHHAHMASCMAENGLEGDVIGVVFDGTGFGPDNTIWGGEFLVGGYDGYRRAGHFRPTPLPGGDAAVREPWRMAMAYLYQALGEDAFTLNHPVTRVLPEQERGLFAQMLRRGINSPLTSSCGRLFDAVAALRGLRHTVSYDGQGAIELEALAELAGEELATYSYKILKSDPSSEQPKNPLSLRERVRVRGNELSSKIPPHPAFGHLLLYAPEGTQGEGNRNSGSPLQLDFSPMFPEILADLAASVPAATIAHRFHRTVATAATELCLDISKATGLERVILSGGVFQNRLLTEMIYTALTSKGLAVFTHRLVPPNDGGIALGQAAIAGKREV